MLAYATITSTYLSPRALGPCIRLARSATFVRPIFTFNLFTALVFTTLQYRGGIQVITFQLLRHCFWPMIDNRCLTSLVTRCQTTIVNGLILAAGDTATLTNKPCVCNQLLCTYLCRVIPLPSVGVKRPSVSAPCILQLSWWRLELFICGQRYRIADLNYVMTKIQLWPNNWD